MSSDPDPTRASRLLAEVQALVHVGIWEWDLATNELYWSDELFQILGLAPNEIVPSFEALLARIHVDDQTSVKANLSRSARPGCPASAYEYRIVRASGELRTIQARVRSWLDDAGTVLRVVGTEQDITESKEMASRMVFSDRMVSVGTLAGGVAHEINNPLATISAQLQFLAETHDDAGTRDARQAVERIRKIVRGLSAFSRVDEDLRSPLDPKQILELAISLSSNELRHHARLVKQLGATPHVNANEARLGHVFLNLLVNAAEAIPEGHAGKHEIRVVTRTDEAGWAVIEVHDTGVGIPRDVQARIFDPFFTTKVVGQGTGLGLSICHGVVRSLGGEITFRTEPGVGTVFTVALPPTNDLARRRRISKSPSVASETRGSVLVVDDDVPFTHSLRRLLGTEHDVTIVHSGREALSRLDAGRRFDVILCDLMMPELTGAELHAVLAERCPTVADSMIFITGGAFTPASQQFLERITNLCFEKPCDINELRAAVRRRVAASRTPA